MRWILKAVAARWPAVAFIATVARWVILFAAGHPLAVTYPVLAFWWGDPLVLCIAGAVVVGVAERWFVPRFVPIVGAVAFAAWFWRTWPMRWAEVAGKTAAVQAVTSGENQQRAAARPVLDAPWLLPVGLSSDGVRFRCGPPPGRTLAELGAVAPSLAASSTRIASVDVDFGRVNDSSGVLVASFVDTLGRSEVPTW